MALSAGTRMGSYEILALLGVGGMGEVYRARDTRLNREVAIKVLPPSVVADSERLRRFEQEAQLLASLNHPAIAALYGVEDWQGTLALVMELVPGQTFAERIAEGPLPAEEAIPLARQIAEALEYAHERGIVHRDLKPANIKLLPDGSVKVLDFGLAKVMEAERTASSDIHSSPTMAAAATKMGLILGTGAYMSPEQAKGKPADRRSDVWSFGCVLYEMLTGKLAFSGETVTDTMAAVVRADPDWTALAADTPAGVRCLLDRCLRKDVKLRLQAIGDARIALEEAFTAGETLPAPLVAGKTRRRISWLALVLVAVVAAALGAWTWRRLQQPPHLTRLSVVLPPGQVLVGSGPAISADGRSIAYVASDTDGVARLYVRALDRFEPTVISNSEGALQPFFSPDGGRVGFFAKGKLLTASLSGGPATVIADASYLTFGGTWGKDGSIIFVPSLNSGLLRVPAGGGTPQRLTEPDEAQGGYGHVWPQYLSGNSVLFTVWTGVNFDADRGAALLSLDTGKWTFLAPTPWSSRYASSGHLLLSAPHGVMAIAYDGKGQPAPQAPTFVVDDVFTTPIMSISWFAVSDSGTLAYVPGNRNLSTLAWVDRTGNLMPVPGKPEPLADPALSPDGTRVVLGESYTLWVLDLRRGTRTRLTLDNEGWNLYPMWSRDGSRILFGSNRGGDWDIYSVSADGGTPKRLLARKGTQFPLSEAPDGTLLFSERGQGKVADLWMLSPSGAATPFLVSSASKVGGQFSPNGRMIAYVSDESGRDEVYVRSVARPDEAIAVTDGGGREPKWAPDSEELFYRRGDAFLAVKVEMAGKLSVGEEKKLFEIKNAAWGQSGNHAGYAMSPDGKRFLVQRLDARAIPTQINVVLNWFDELKSRVGRR